MFLTICPNTDFVLFNKITKFFFVKGRILFKSNIQNSEFCLSFYRSVPKNGNTINPTRNPTSMFYCSCLEWKNRINSIIKLSVLSRVRFLFLSSSLIQSFQLSKNCSDSTGILLY